MPLHDIHYQHWDGRHRNIWYRRAMIAQNGLKGCLQGKWMRQLLLLCWSAALVAAAVLFMVGQLLIADSLVVRSVANLNPNLQALVKSLVTWLEQHPEISVHTTQNLFFYYFATILATLNLIAIALALPYLVTRDLFSGAIVVYSAKALGRFDYLLGKLAAILGVMALAWLGPVCAAWFLGNLLAPHWSFFWHSRAALGNILVYVLGSMLILSVIALGVSSLAGNERATVSIWVVLWLVGNAFQPISMAAGRPWLKHFSFSYNLDQIALAAFRLGDNIRAAQDNIPILGTLLRGIPPRTFASWDHPALAGALAGLGALMVLATLVLAKKVKPE